LHPGRWHDGESMRFSHKPRRHFHPRVEALEPRDVPVQLVFTDTPVFLPGGDPNNSGVTVSVTPFNYGEAWEGTATVAPPSGAAANGFFPGSFNWGGNLDLTLQAESGEVNGTPVTITLSTGGLLTWDLDPKNSGGYSTNSVSVAAGLDAAPVWFDLSDGQSTPANHSETSSQDNGNGFEVINTTIGSTIRIVVNSSGQSDAWTKADGTPRGKVSADFQAGYYMPPDLVAGAVTFNPAGGVDFQYSVNFTDITGTAPKAQLFWGDDNGPTGAALYTEDVPLARGVYNRHLNSVAAPPSGATRLWLVVDGEQVTDEQSFDNNKSSSAPYNFGVTFTGAKFDGDSRPDVVGRFFAGISAPGENYTLQLSPDVASFVTSSSQVVVKVGNTTLTAARSDPTAAWDHRTYVTSSHDPGLLTKSTPLTVQIIAGGHILATATETIDVEPLPTWLTNVKPLTKSFDTNTLTYSFSGPMLNVTTGSRSGPPGFTQYGLGGANRVDVTASMQFEASLIPDGALVDFGGTGHAKGWYYGRQLFDVTGSFPSAGPFDSTLTFDGGSLAITGGSLTFNLNSGQNYSDIFATPAYTKGYFRLVPHVNANVNYTVAMNAVFLPDGRLDPNSATLSFNYQGLLTGTLKPAISLGPTLDAALWTLNNVLGVPTAVTDQIRHDVHGTRAVPTVDLNSTVTGELDANATLGLGGAGLNSSTTLKAFHTLLDLVPTVSFTVTWPANTYTVNNSSPLSKYFTIHITT
jgi:hypothetical protein